MPASTHADDTDVADKLLELVKKAPVGGLFHNAVVTDTLAEASLGVGVPNRSSASFTITLANETKFLVRVERMF